MKNRILLSMLFLSLFALNLMTGCKQDNANVNTQYESLMNEGLHKFESGDFAGAKKIYQTIVNSDNRNTKARLRLASVNLCLNPDGMEFIYSLDSISGYDRVVGKLRTRYYTHSKRVWTNEELEETPEDVNDISNEKEIFTKALDKNPRDARLLFGRGCWKFIMSDKYGAIKDFTEAIRIDSNFYQAYFMLGKCYRDNLIYMHVMETRRGYYQALFYFLKANQLNPNDTHVIREMKNIYKFFNNWEGLQQVNTRLYELNPSDHQALFEAARAKAVLGNYTESIEDLKLLVKLNPQESGYLLELGGAKIKAGDKAGGQKDIDRADEIFRKEKPDNRTKGYHKKAI